MRQTHELWHEAAAAYPDAGAFTLKLNACLQAARSVTFVLQKELSKRDWFDEWYEPWQDRMRADRRMRWLVEARNQVEKQGDLDTASEAFVSLASTVEEHLMARTEVPPLASPTDIAAAVDVEGLGEELRKDCVLIVERRWTVEELPDDELLDVIGHCYGVLARLLAEAHERCGVTMRTFGGETHGGPHERRPHPTGRLPCMVATAEDRTAYWHLGVASLLQEVTREHVIERNDDFSDVEARYGALPSGSHRALHPDLPAIEHARYLHEMAKALMRVDGMHWPIAFLYRDGRQIDMQTLATEDQQDKVVQIRTLAARVDRHGAEGVVFTNETWLAPVITNPGDPRARLRAGERDDRREALCTYLLQRGEEPLMLLTPISRDHDGGAVLGDTEETAFQGPSIFAPVLRVWADWEASGASPSSGGGAPVR